MEISRVMHAPSLPGSDEMRLEPNKQVKGSLRKDNIRSTLPVFNIEVLKILFNLDKCLFLTFNSMMIYR